MKKIYLLMLALIVGLTASAASYYIKGDFYNSYKSEVEFTTYCGTILRASLTTTSTDPKFVVRYGGSSTADSDTYYKNGTVTVGDGTQSWVVLSTGVNDDTLNGLESGKAYDIYFDTSNKSIFVVPEGTAVKFGYFLKGTFNGGGDEKWGDPIQMSLNTGNTSTLEFMVEKLQVTSGSSWTYFQIAMKDKNGEEKQWWGGYSNSIVSAGSNYKMSTWSSGTGTNCSSNLDTSKAYTFYFKPTSDNGTLYIKDEGTASSSTSETYYYFRTISGNTETNYALTLSSDGYYYTDAITLSAANVNVLAYSADADKKEDSSSKYWGSNNTTLAADETYTASTWSHGSSSAKGSISTSLSANSSYIFRFSPTKNTIKAVTQEEGSVYYFYGDLNLWSIKDIAANCGVQAHAKDANDSDISDQVWTNEEDRPYYYDEAALKADWNFKPCNTAHPYPSDVSGVSGDNSSWYYLDFSNLSDYEGNHTGRLCGQFKITCGDHGIDNWGIYRNNDDLGYLKNKITPGELYSGVTKGEGLQNFQLNVSYVDGAVLYFNPTDLQIVITGTSKYIYTYYIDARTSTDSHSAPTDWKISDLSQVNYYANSNGFNYGSTSAGTSKADYNYDNIFNWESTSVEIDGVTYQNAWRRLIPSGATHRFPVLFNIDVRNSKGAWMGAQTVDCDNLYFIEADAVNVYFRYADNRDLTWAGYNLYRGERNSSGVVDSYVFAYYNDDSSKRSLSTVSASGNDNWVSMTKIGELEGDGNNWFKSPVSVPAAYTNGGIALFRTSDGSAFPAGLMTATENSLKKGTLKGTDLYYVVGDNTGRVTLLYNHVKGSFDTSMGDLQIQAEFFDADDNLDTSLGTNKYRFEVYNGTSKILEQDYSEEPFATVSSWDNITEATYLQIVVKVKDENGTRYTYQDVYPVYAK
jgi:hypothetical protein